MELFFGNKIIIQTVVSEVIILIISTELFNQKING